MTFVHPNGLCESATVGEGTRVWAFAHVLPGAVIGRDCNICDGVFVENDVVLGDRVTVKCGVQLWDGLRVGDDVFIGPNASFANDPWPRSKVWPEQFPQTVLGDGCSIGANATILPGLTIGARAMVGAGAVVTRDVPDGAVVVGNPARIVGWCDDRGQRLPALAGPLPEGAERLRLALGASVDPAALLAALPFAPARSGLLLRAELPRTAGRRAYLALRGQAQVRWNDLGELELDEGWALVLPAGRAAARPVGEAMVMWADEN